MGLRWRIVPVNNLYNEQRIGNARMITARMKPLYVRDGTGEIADCSVCTVQAALARTLGYR